ncbi:MAG: hypothetical protein LBD23_03430, partial [Oscillospiraceae bacterium]|nr:hypothetical protein [Oscillospiraceae bacterium]
LWGEESNKIIKAVEIDCKLRGDYITKRMNNKYVISIPTENISCPGSKDNVNFTDFEDGFEFLRANLSDDTSEYEFLPYFRQAQDISIGMFVNSICMGKAAVSHDLYIKEIIKEVSSAPIKSREIPNKACNMLSVGDNIKSNKLKIAIANVDVKGVWNLENALKGRKPNRKSTRYKALAKLMNEAIVEKADVLVFPENYIPFEWLNALASKSAREGLAIITGVEHIIVKKKNDKEKDRVYNYTAIILPFKYFDAIPTVAVFFQLKKHYSPEEKRVIEGYGYAPVIQDENRPLYRWHDCYFPVYCCYELTDIHDRSMFMSWADMVVAVEYNKDTNYFGSIVESLTRDLHCYCVQVNTSEYGDSRITQPKKTEEQNMIVVKGGKNASLLIDEIDIQALREFHLAKYELQKYGAFKPTPPGIDVDIVKQKQNEREDVE